MINQFLLHFEKYNTFKFATIRFMQCSSTMQKTYLTGIQPTGTPHLGNYLSMIKPCTKLQSSTLVSKLIVCIADLHALASTKYIPQLSSNVINLAAFLLASGIGNTPIQSSNCKTIMFSQSSVRGHCELAWILSTRCSINRLCHLPQWREKSSVEQQTDFKDSSASVALFTYPILQAADILLYNADVVPVGEDQVKHLELARDLARNASCEWPALCKEFRIPEISLYTVPKVYNLRDPKKKMSKSYGPEMGTIWLTDTPDSIQLKVSKSVTDSIKSVYYDPETRPGISNLLQIYAALKDVALESAVGLFATKSKIDFKSSVTDAIVEELLPIQKRAGVLLEQTTIDGSYYVQTILNDGSNKANDIASIKLHNIFKCLGLSYF